jgi:hypothetical protein
VVLLVCELVLGTPVLAPVVVEPVVPVLDGVVAVAEPLGVEEALTVPLGVLAEAVVLGVLVEAVALVLGVLALVPGAEALVLPVVEAVPVWLDAPEGVVLLPGVVALAVVLGAELVLLLGVVELAEAFAPLISAELADELLGLQLPFTRTFCPMKPLRSWLVWISTILALLVWR